MWHANVEAVWKYLGPALKKFGASLAQTSQVKNLIRKAVSDCPHCERARRVH